MLNTTEQLYPWALTTVQRVKDRVFDAPNNFLNITGTLTLNSTSVTSVSNITSIQQGMQISGAGIPSGTIVAAVSGSTITLSAAATQGGTGVAITVINQPPQYDLVITRMINSLTDFIERECGKSGMERYPNDGHFQLKQYVNEVYSVNGTKQIYLPLRNSPVFYLTVTGNLTANSAVVMNVTPSAGIQPGMPLYAADGLFPQNTIVSTVSGTTVTMSAPASVTQNGAVFEISGLASFQWRAGTPDAPSWTSFFPPQYELEQQGYSGIVRVYGPIPRIYSNMVRATYWAGYPMDWANAGNGSTHRLPADLSNTCENTVVRIFKRRMLEGNTSLNISGATTSWKDQLDALDLNVIKDYRRVGMIF